MKFYIHKLGCPKNDVDADYIAARLIKAGHEPVEEPADADSVLVNTCGFIRDAKQESIDEILRLGQLKTNGRVKKLMATGCLSQRYGDELLSEMPELDAAFGHGTLDSIAEALSGPAPATERHAIRRDCRDLTYLDFGRRHVADASPYAYLKISDGCDKKCTYCAIPAMRGKYRSRPMQSILNEAQFLAEQGKRELILVSQEATCYGIDLPDRLSLLDLLKELEKIEGLAWIRIMYLYPPAVNQELIDYMLADNKTLAYFDLPFQHVSAGLLRAMRRPMGPEAIERLLAQIRSGGDQATIRASFMVGFPGETEEDFAQLREFVVRHRFDRMGVFQFSAEEETVAEGMSDQVDEVVMAARMDELMTLQRDIAFDENNSLIGESLQVIIDTVDSGGRAIGRTVGDCPEIDQEVMLNSPGLKVGEIVQVQIRAADGYDLEGDISEN